MTWETVPPSSFSSHSPWRSRELATGVFVLAVSSDISRVKCMMQSVRPRDGLCFTWADRRIVSIVCYPTRCFVARGFLGNTDEFKLSIDDVGDNDCRSFGTETQKQFMN